MSIDKEKEAKEEEAKGVAVVWSKFEARVL